jgi:hypothetical protein
VINDYVGSKPLSFKKKTFLALQNFLNIAFEVILEIQYEKKASRSQHSFQELKENTRPPYSI